MLLAVRTDERLDSATAAARHRRFRAVAYAASAAVVAAASAAAADGGATAIHVAAFLHDGIKVAGRVRPALAAQRMAAAARRQRRRHRSAATAAGVRTRRQVNACRTHVEDVLNTRNTETKEPTSSNGTSGFWTSVGKSVAAVQAHSTFVEKQGRTRIYFLFFGGWLLRNFYLHRKRFK